MTRSLLIPSLLLLATVATTTSAHADPEWVNSASQYTPANCVAGQLSGIETWVGYVDDINNRLTTGDSRYVHATAKNVGCSGDGVSMEIFLPAGATRDLSKGVNCIREKVDGTKEPMTNCAPSGFAGPNGGLMFATGATTLAPLWYLEIQIPVVYDRELLGAAGGTGHALRVKTVTANANAFPSVPVTVSYRARMEHLVATDITATSATVGLKLTNYFKSGQFSIEYGTTPALGSNTNPGAISSSFLFYNSSGASLTNLAPNTTYHWRGRFVTNNGAFTSAIGTFTTSPTAAVVLSVATSGRGLGKVTSDPVGLDCGAYSANVCAVNTAPGITVSLYATPSSPSYVFAGWSGACTGTGRCIVSMTAAKSVTASFELFDSTTATPVPDPRPRRL